MKEKDLIEELTRANRELLSLYDVNRLLQTPLTTEEKLYIILTSLTASDGFGYSRAYLFMINPNTNTLGGWLGVGPLSGDEAREIWESVASLVDEDGEGVRPGGRPISEILERAPFDIKVRDFIVPITRGLGHPVQTVISRRPKLVRDVSSGKDPLHPDFISMLSCQQVAFIPLLSKNSVIGVMAVESPGGERSIDENSLRTLTVFGNLAAIALENSKLYRALEEKVNSLEMVNRELQEAHAKILHLDRLSSLGAIAAGLAHEIKNPLNSLIINLDLLRSEAPDDCGEVVNLIDIIETESVRLNETVTEFLSFAKAQKLSLDTSHPHHVLDQVLKLVEYQGEHIGIKITRDYDEAVMDLVLDEKRMKQAFLNVVINAMQAMPSGGTLSVKTGLKKHEANPECGHIVIEFKDTGQGITADCMKRIFDPFYTTKEEGTGMGLPIVDSIMRSHGGKVQIESTAGKGTKVTLSLPANGGAANG